jgi:hypothetical protein
MDRETQRQIVAVHRNTAANPKLTRAYRDLARERAGALERLLGLGTTSWRRSAPRPLRQLTSGLRLSPAKESEGTHPALLATVSIPPLGHFCSLFFCGESAQLLARQAENAGRCRISDYLCPLTSRYAISVGGPTRSLVRPARKLSPARLSPLGLMARKGGEEARKGAMGLPAQCADLPRPGVNRGGPPKNPYLYI